MRLGLTLAAALALATTVPATSTAQRLRDARSAVVPNVRPTPDTAPRRGPVKTARLFAGMAAMVAGAAVVGYAGYGLEVASCRGTCGEFEGLGGFLLGAIAGGLVGSSGGVALLSYRSPCSGGERFGRALGGTLIGAVVGGFAAAALGSQTDNEVFPVAVAVIMPPLGATLVQGPC